MVSKKFKEAVKTSLEPAYVIAQKAGLHQSTLSQLLNNIVPVQDNDERVIAVGKVLGLKPKECFDANIQNRKVSHQ